MKNGLVARLFRRRRTASALIAVVIIGAAAAFWLKFGAADEDPLFHGVAESIWIKDLAYNDRTQVEEWRRFGAEGIQVLVRGFEKATDRSGRVRRRVDRAAPRWLRRHLPDAPTDRGMETRGRIASLLWSLGEDAQSAAPAMIRFVKQEEDVSVMQSLVGYFVTRDDNSVLNKLSPAQRHELAPVFIAVMQKPEMDNVRHNASMGFKYFQEDADRVAPVLVSALKDRSTFVRLYAAEALNRIAPTTAKEAGAMTILLKLVDDGSNQVATEAVRALGRPGMEIETAVRTLVDCLQRKNPEVACQAVWTLEWAPKEFHGFADSIIPALQVASRRDDHVAGYAKVALTRWERQEKQRDAEMNR